MPFDIRLALRALVRQPGLSSAVVVTVGLALAANTALFSVFDGLLFRPLPYPEADRLVHLELPPLGTRLSAEREGEISERLETTTSLELRANVRRRELFDQSGDAVTVWGLSVVEVSPAFFELFGARPLHGRVLTAEDASATPFTIVVSYEVWQRQFGGDPSVVGTFVDIPGTAVEDRWFLAGVLRPAFEFPAGADVWIPEYSFFSNSPIPSYGRLAAGTTPESLRSELPGLIVTPLRDYVVPGGAWATGLLLAGSAMLLLVAWVQIGGLVFARLASRSREIGVRLALGGRRFEVWRPFVYEAAALAFCGLCLAWIAAGPFTSAIVLLLPSELTAGQHLDPDLRALAFASMMSTIGLMVLTVLPLDVIRRSAPVDLLRMGASGPMARAARVRTALFVAQLSLAAALVYVTGLGFESWRRVSRVDYGFDASNLLGVAFPTGDRSLTPAATRDYPAEAELRRTRLVEAVSRLRQLDGVDEVIATSSWPVSRGGLSPSTFLSNADATQRIMAGLRATVQPGFASLVGVRIVEGAEPSVEAAASATNRLRPAVVNQTLADELRAFGPPVGQVLVVSTASGAGYQVTGVIEDLKHGRPDAPVVPTVYVYLHSESTGRALIRANRDAAALVPAIRGIVADVWGERWPSQILIFSDVIREASVDYRARTTLLGLIAALCLPLTMIGVAGALSFAMRQRTREIAIRFALGADPRAVKRRVVIQALAAAAVAIAAGVALGAGVGRVTSAFLYGVSPIDARVVAMSAAVMLAVAGLAAWLPARRAARISPAAALRE